MRKRLWSYLTVAAAAESVAAGLALYANLSRDFDFAHDVQRILSAVGLVAIGAAIELVRANRGA